MAAAAAKSAAKAALLEQPSPVTAAKAIKTQAELEGMREAHLRDAVALAQTLHWVETQVGLHSTPTTQPWSPGWLRGGHPVL